jgi:hypothetical protein
VRPPTTKHIGNPPSLRCVCAYANSNANSTGDNETHGHPTLPTLQGHWRTMVCEEKSLTPNRRRLRAGEVQGRHEHETFRQPSGDGCLQTTRRLPSNNQTAAFRQADGDNQTVAFRQADGYLQAGGRLPSGRRTAAFRQADGCLQAGGRLPSGRRTAAFRQADSCLQAG